MRNRYDNDFKVMIAELLNSGRKVREITEEYVAADDRKTEHFGALKRYSTRWVGEHRKQRKETTRCG